MAKCAAHRHHLCAYRNHSRGPRNHETAHDTKPQMPQRPSQCDNRVPDARLQVAVRAGNHLDHREVEVEDAELRIRDIDGQTYRVDLNQPELLRQLLRCHVAEPTAPPPIRLDG